MLEITDELIQKIDKILAKGERNRNKILGVLIGDDDSFKKILELYKSKKNEYDILEETRLPIELIRNTIKNIDELNRLIDQKVKNITIKKFYEKKAEKENIDKHLTLEDKIKESRKREINQKKNAEKNLSAFFNNYLKAKHENKLNTENLRKNLDNVKLLIDLLGNKPSHMLFLASIYNDLGDYKKSSKILHLIKDENFTQIEKRNFNIIKDEIKVLRNKKFITMLFDEGLSFEQIAKECEKQVGEFRVFIDRNFIKQTLDEYKRQKDKKTNQKEDNDLEL